MNGKRLFDLSFTIPGLLFLLPLFAIAAFLIKLDSQGPVFFRQVRMGRYGKPFRIFKFRTMVDKREAPGLNLTQREDRRITKIGRILRKYKIDEFPQLINVLKGDMSLVGPRPEVPEYINEYLPAVRALILSVRPGITDYASIEYRDENRLLDGTADPERIYVEQILPIKAAYYAKYVREGNIILDFKLIARTFQKLYAW